MNAETEPRMFPVGAAIIGSVWSRRGQHARWRATKDQDVRRTPRALFDELDAEFGFTIDVAALPDNALCQRFFTPEDDGLAQDWTGERCWMNPPYSLIEPWVAKAVAETRRAAELVVGLLPVRTDLAWFHEHVMAAGAEVRFIRGRVRFNASGTDAETYPVRSNAAFPSMVVVWRADGEAAPVVGDSSDRERGER